MENENKLPAANVDSKEYHEQLKGSDADYAATGPDDQQSDPAEELKGSDADFAYAGELDNQPGGSESSIDHENAAENDSSEDNDSTEHERADD